MTRKYIDMHTVGREKERQIYRKIDTVDIERA